MFPRAELYEQAKIKFDRNDFFFKKKGRNPYFEMAVQKEVDMQNPLDATKKAKLETSSLKPDLVQAALVLHADYYTQARAACNKFIFWNPITVSIVALAFTLLTVKQYDDFISMSSSIGEFLSFATKDEVFLLRIFTVLPFFLCILGGLIMVIYFMTDVFGDIVEHVLKGKYDEEIFGFNVRKFALLNINKESQLLPKEAELLKKGNNTLLFVYRETPIAIVTIRPLLERSNDTNFYVKISGVQVRKVYAKVDFHSWMIEWVLGRSRQLFQEYVKRKNTEGCKINILTDAYSFDSFYINLLKKKSFGKISAASNLDPFDKNNRGKRFFGLVPSGAIFRLFNIFRETYGVTLLTKDMDQDILYQNTTTQKHEGPKGRSKKQ